MTARWAPTAATRTPWPAARRRNAVLAELLGRAGGICGGKGGSMHITSVPHGYYGSYAIVGAHLPVACGLAWAAKIRRTGQVTVCFFGDGATNIGAFHEAVNLAAVWRLPVVFVCENNWYMEYTPIADVIPVALPAADRAAAYGLDRIVVDGNDVAAVRDKALYARKEEAPEGEHVLPLGQARIVRAGSDLTLVGLSITVGTCLAAADELAGQGVSAEVIDLRTLVPLDAAAVLGSVARTGRLVVVEENPGQLGWGASVAAIAAQEAFGSLTAPVTRVSGGNVPLPVAASLEAEVDVTVARVVAAAQAVLGHGRQRSKIT